MPPGFWLLSSQGLGCVVLLLYNSKLWIVIKSKVLSSVLFDHLHDVSIKRQTEVISCGQGSPPALYHLRGGEFFAEAETWSLCFVIRHYVSLKLMELKIGLMVQHRLERILILEPMHRFENSVGAIAPRCAELIWRN